jgi:N-acetylmuramoyl-L-alanine amidase
MKIVISSGHGKHVPGASEIIDEVTEARKVVEKVAEFLRADRVDVVTFHDDTSTTQAENLDTIVAFHNSQERDLDVSVHFNCYVETEGERGTEVLYLTQEKLAAEIADAISSAADFINRRAHKRTDLKFLNATDEPAVLLEICFVDAQGDVDKYLANFDSICQAIAEVENETGVAAAHFEGKCSWFGGPDDDGVAPDEGLAFIYEVEQAPHLFLETQPEGTSGLARRLDPNEYYVACRWNYDVTPKSMLADPTIQALVIAGGGAKRLLAWPADWGPHEDTGRAADISPGLMEALGIKTDDQVEVIYPAKYAGLGRTSAGE